MLVWLKEILGEHYTEEVDSSISKKIGESFVPKSEHIGTVQTSLCFVASKQNS